MNLPEWLIALMVLSGLSPFGIAAALWKFGLPWLREQVAQPAQAAAYAVTVNSHSSQTPTVLDKLADVAAAVGRVGVKVDELDKKLDDHLIAAAALDGANAVRLDGHDREIGRLNDATFRRRPDDN